MTDPKPLENLNRHAFRDVTRQGGISWSEADGLDNYASPKNCPPPHLRQGPPLAGPRRRPVWAESWPYRDSYRDSIGFRFDLAPPLSLPPPRVHRTSWERTNERTRPSFPDMWNGELVEVYEGEGWILRMTTDTPCLLFRSNLDICVDGALRSYHPDDISGLDCLHHAKDEDGKWVGVASKNKVPYVQGPDFEEGFYVPQTHLADDTIDDWIPTKYVDPLEINYLVIPHAAYEDLNKRIGLELGSLGFVYSETSKELAYCIFAETGPDELLGETSFRAACQLKVEDVDPRTGGDSDEKYIYGVFPNPSTRWRKPQQEIDCEGRNLFKAWGGHDRLTRLAGQLSNPGNSSLFRYGACRPTPNPSPERVPAPRWCDDD